MRVRQSPASELAATRLGARAFTIGRDIHLGPTASPADDRLLLHEAVHTMQQGEAPRARGVSRVEGAHERNAASVVDAIERGAAATVLSDAPAVVFRDVIDDVRNKLSYKLLDWAVTDADAEQSLALLNSIPDATLAVQIARLEDKYVTRLLDNLPDRDKTGPQYTRIIQALGPRTAGFVENRLSRGLFDWAVTDEDAGDVFNVFANYTPVQQDQFMESLLDRKRLATLIANATGSQEALYLRPWIEHLRPVSAAFNLTFKQDEILRVITMETDTAETARIALGVRFNLDVGTVTPAQQVSTGKPADQVLPASFTLSQLRDAFKVLEQLPPGHVERNNALDRLTRFRSGDSGSESAWYSSSSNEASIGATGADSQFENFVRHEVGHGVDQKLGRAATAPPADKAGWVQYLDATGAAIAAVTSSTTQAIAGLSAVDITSVVSEMVVAMASKDTDNPKVVAALRAKVAALAFWATLPAAGRDNFEAACAARSCAPGRREQP